MNIRILITVLVGALLCNTTHAQHVLSGFGLSWDGTDPVKLGISGTDTPDHNLDAASGPDYYFGVDRHDRENGPKLYDPSHGDSSNHAGSGHLDDSDDDGRDHHGVTIPGLDHHGVPVNCSPIPEPSAYAALLGLAIFGVAAWRRKFEPRLDTLQN